MEQKMVHRLVPCPRIAQRAAKKERASVKMCLLTKEENKHPGSQGGPMTSIAYSPISIQTSSQFVPSTPSWFGEATLLTRHLQRHGVLSAMEEQARFARRRFGRY